MWHATVVNCGVHFHGNAKWKRVTASVGVRARKRRPFLGSFELVQLCARLSQNFHDTRYTFPLGGAGSLQCAENLVFLAIEKQLDKTTSQRKRASASQNACTAVQTMGTTYTRDQDSKQTSERSSSEGIQSCPTAHRINGPSATIGEPQACEKAKEAKAGCRSAG